MIRFKILAILYFTFVLLYTQKLIQSKKILSKIKRFNNGTCFYKNQYIPIQYELPSNVNIKGTSFNCDLVRYLDYFKLLDENDFVDLSKEKMPRPQVVTAFSENHRDEAALLLKSFRKHFPGQKIIVYSLGVSKSTEEMLRSLCYVEYKVFKLSKYPKHVSNIMNYAFKILIAAETLKKHGAMIWADASVRFKKTNMNYVYNLFNCKYGKDFDHKEKEQAALGNEPRHKPFLNVYRKLKCRKCFWKYRYTGFDKNVYNFNVNHCHKSSFMFTVPTFHGILPTIHSKTLKYFPTEKKRYANKTISRQYDAAFSIIVKTKDTVDNVLKWAVLCALEKNCIEAEKWHGCYGFTRKNIFSSHNVCYRFDQSILTLLLHNSNNYDNRNYVTEIHNFIDIDRNTVTDLDSLEKSCL
uniref:Nucleotide-diphospho-sugar transferase domain-containing protein n=1 Tax=Strongyloides papillosus TaxID=174720 RepID=A0A0N5C141_STREA